MGWRVFLKNFFLFSFHILCVEVFSFMFLMPLLTHDTIGFPRSLSPSLSLSLSLFLSLSIKGGDVEMASKTRSERGNVFQIIAEDDDNYDETYSNEKTDEECSEVGYDINGERESSVHSPIPG